MQLNIPERFYEQIVREASALPEVQRVILFGSRARGDHMKYSDIDLAIDAPQLNDREWSELHEQLTDEADTLLEVEAVRLENTQGRFLERILRDGKVIYDRRTSTGYPGDARPSARTP